MPWLFLLLSVAAFVLAFMIDTSVVMVALCLIAALVFLVLWVMGLLAQRVGSQSRDDVMLLDPAELRRLREQAEARRAAAATPGEPPAA